MTDTSTRPLEDAETPEHEHDPHQLLGFPPYREFLRHIHLGDPTPPADDLPPLSAVSEVSFDGHAVGHQLPQAPVWVSAGPDRETRVHLTVYARDVTCVWVPESGVHRVLVLGRDVLTPPFSEIDVREVLAGADEDDPFSTVDIVVQVARVTIG